MNKYFNSLANIIDVLSKTGNIHRVGKDVMLVEEALHKLECYDFSLSLDRHTVDISDNIPYLTVEGDKYKVLDATLGGAIDTLGQLEDIYRRYEDNENNND